jgi:hypothetical protein
VAFTTNTPSPWVVPPLPEVQVSIARRSADGTYSPPTMVSVTAAGAPANGHTLFPMVSGSGGALIVGSYATDLPVAPATPGSMNGLVIRLDASR